MNVAFVLMVVIAALFAGFSGTADAVGMAALSGAKTAVELVLSLAGSIIFFLGLTSVVEAAGGLKLMARAIRPLMVRLFPNVPADHPAMGAMIMNLAANALGLGNAATPFGLKAMAELSKIAPRKGEASDAMCLFLAINTSGLALLPTGIIALRAGLGSQDPAAILPTTLLATAASTVAGVSAALLLRRLPMFRASAPVTAEEPQAVVDLDVAEEQASSSDQDALSPQTVEGESWLPLLSIAAVMIALVVMVHLYGSRASAWILPGLITSMVLFGALRGVKVYEAFLSGAKEGLDLALSIIPYLVAILGVVSMLRASGAVDAMVSATGELFAALGFPAEVLPLALLRPLTGSGAFAVTAELAKTHGPDSVIGLIATTMNGSTETTFYVLAVYFGSVGVTRARYAVAAGLTADVVGALMSVVAVHWLLL